MPTLRERQQEVDELATSARTILDQAEEEGRALTDDESARFDQIMADVDTGRAAIRREQQLRDVERDLDRQPAPTDDLNQPGGAPDGEDDVRAGAFEAYLRGGHRALSEDQARALSMGSDPDGGYLVAPEQFTTDLIEAIDDMVFIRGWATVHQLESAQSLGRPSRDADVDDADWTSELSSGSDDTGLKFGKRELSPNPLAKRVKVSRTLLRRSPLGPERIVRERLAYKFGITQEKAFLTGDGVDKPLGVFTASDDGISTSRDVNSGAANDISAEGFIDAKYALKGAYHSRARWLLHRTLVRDLRKLRDDSGGAGTGQFLWQPGMGGTPDTLLDIPYGMSEYAPNTVTDGSYIAVLGDFSRYEIAESLQFEVQRLVELYAETNQVGFIGRQEADAMPVLEEAFVRVKVGA